MDIGNDAQQIAHIQQPRLLGDIRRRIMQAEEFYQIRLDRFRDDFAGFVLVEAVDHDPVEADQRAQLAGGLAGELLERCRALHAHEHGPDH